VFFSASTTSSGIFGGGSSGGGSFSSGVGVGQTGFGAPASPPRTGAQKNYEAALQCHQAGGHVICS